MAGVFRSGATAVISGGASGVGFAFAKLCRGHGMNLALLDISSSNLEKAREALKPKDNEKTETYTMDVSSMSDWSKVRVDVESKFGSVDLLMLNAGAAFQPEGGKPWEDPEYFHKTFAVNVFGPVNGLAAFLPLVQKTKDSASVVITGSKQGITNPPGNPAYNASKSMVKTITEHLAHDLRTSNPNISVHLLIPGWSFYGPSRRSRRMWIKYTKTPQPGRRVFSLEGEHSLGCHKRER
jgi:NAD(P)-dependent dehydrogenase (short-subunit alcohol dehydrogenase family)